MRLNINGASSLPKGDLRWPETCPAASLIFRTPKNCFMDSFEATSMLQN